jgi:hypothetical protein
MYLAAAILADAEMWERWSSAYAGGFGKGALIGAVVFGLIGLVKLLRGKSAG